MVKKVTEQFMWQRLRRLQGLPVGPRTIFRIESGSTYLGIPDVGFLHNGHAGYVELKVSQLNPDKFDMKNPHIQIPHFTHQQRLFLEHCDRSFLLVYATNWCWIVFHRSSGLPPVGCPDPFPLYAADSAFVPFGVLGTGDHFFEFIFSRITPSAYDSSLFNPPDLQPPALPR
jgi:hypothetical protein